MASKTLANLEKEVTCPICLELLTEPLSLGCGHSLCQACVTLHNEKTGKDSGCPVCGIRDPRGNLWPNHHLADIVEKLREVKLSTGIGKKGDFCALHGEKLQLFCKDDGKVICWLCERSQEHRGHHTFLMEEVAQECQEKLQAALKRLRKEQQEAEKLKADIREDKLSWKYQMQNEKQRIRVEFNWFRHILENEEQRELRRLEKEEKAKLDILAQAEAELVQQSQVVTELISDLERRSLWSAVELLQDMSGIMKWSEIWTLRKPKTPSKRLKKRGLCASDLTTMLELNRELKDIQGYWVDFTLNPVNLNLNLVLSEDHRQVRPVPIWPVRCDNYGILGSQCFSSGKHYWEIDVSSKTAWVLGIYCRKPVKFAVNRSTILSNPFSRYTPQHGYWVIGLQKKLEYYAFDESSAFDPKVLALSVALPLHRVGVFLNFEAGTVSFFNITNHGSLIYRFCKCYYSRPVYPYFNPWDCPAPLTLCPPSS
ncbi:E3 ubiquitin-protein ligase TRIM34 [Cavia porcellus]|uniref:Tripartite motif containing 34 n=1 Tax=Cavia porcellus TaxID=10141 RepID=A0A286Y332_CAVPO|nr:tripartite motif-containing protein 34 [Cavia porcellus]